jgi:hypothetical protein
VREIDLEMLAAEELECMEEEEAAKKGAAAGAAAASNDKDGTRCLHQISLLYLFLFYLQMKLINCP